MKRINRVFWIVFSVALFFALVSAKDFAAHAATTTGVIGECEWSLDGTVLTISGNGSMDSYVGESAPWGTSITKVVIEEGVTSIGSAAFYSCNNLTEVSISNTVETIGWEAFHWCDALEEIVLPEGIKSIEARVFEQCHSLKSICIPASVVSIGTNPFRWCSDLTSIRVAEGNTHFFSEGDCLVERSTGVLISGCENSVIPENAGIKEIGYHAFNSIEGLEEVIIPYGVERINGYAFWSCGNLVKVEIPETVEYIDPDALRFLNPQATVTISEDNKTYHSSGNCIIETDSKTIIVGYSNSTIPADDSVTIIGDNAFYGSMALIDLYIPDNITAIGDDAFVECRNLVNIHIGKGITDISNRAFYYCRSLETISVDPDNSRYCAVGNCLIDTQTKILIKGTKNSIVPADGSVDTIGAYAFYGIDIPSIKLPEGIKHVKEFAFSEIVEIELPHSLDTLLKNAFLTCDKLERVLYSGSVKERNALEDLYKNLGNEALFDVEWQYGTKWADSGIEFLVKDLQVMQKRDSYSPGYDDLYYERYSINPIIEVRFADGSTISGNSYEIEEQTGKRVHFYDNQSYAKQWNVGDHNTVTAYFMGETTEFTVTVVENAIKSIEVEPIEHIEFSGGQWYGGWDEDGNYVSDLWYYYHTEPEKMTVKFKDGSEFSGGFYEVNDQIRKQYGFLDYGYSDGGQYENQWGVGEYTVFISIWGVKAEYTVTVNAKSLTSISITQKPNKLTYIEGEPFDATGMVITAYYNDYTSAVITDYTVSGFSSIVTVGTKSITVSYCGQTASFEVTVICRNHAYTNACDTACNECGYTRTISHTYDNACDDACDICGALRIVTHDYTGATCLTPETCKTCGATSGKALGHSYAAATCTKAKTCTRCKVTSGKALGHSYAAATCTKAKTCTRCKVTSGKALEHSYKTTTTKATTTKNGSIVKKCTVCGKVASTTTIRYVKTVKLYTTTYTYNGKVKTPTVIVKDSAGKALQKDTDYTVTYPKGRTNAGTYKITVKLKGNYTGTKTLTFKINPAKAT